MAQAVPRIGDVGTVFETTIVDQDDLVVDISLATTKTLKFRKPDASTATKTASFVTDGTDGKLKYTTVTNDLDQAGDWKAQAVVVFTGSATQWTSTIHDFRVGVAL